MDTQKILNQIHENETYNLVICTADKVPADLKFQYGQLRYNAFSKDDPFVNLCHNTRTEFDRYDKMDTTLYIMATAQREHVRELIVACRCLPTLFDYELEMPSWSYLTDHIIEGESLPKSGKVFESMRWVTVPRKRSEAHVGAGIVAVGMYQAGLDYGFKEIIGVTTGQVIEFIKRQGKTTRSITPPLRNERDKDSLEIHYQILDEAFLRASIETYEQALAREVEQA